MIGESILHYKIIEKLGEGGMGVVYLAKDTKLKRQVAIKFLPRHIASNAEDKSRFEIEAQAAASLNHPNITTIHAIEETDNETFIVMEYIKGIELKDKIKSGPIPTEEIISIAVQIAEGLKAAHENNIVHRDIKSQNIMITAGGNVKIMDFGLAKVDGGSQLTKTGTTFGTIAYMSPEQTRGGKIDKRSDIWSFGVVLYEMLTGVLPFRGDYDQAIIYSIMNEEPEPFQNISSNIGSVLMNIIHKTLEKNPGDRYQSMSDILTDFESISVQTSGEIQRDKYNVLKSYKTGSQIPGKTLKQNRFPDLFSKRIFQFTVGVFFVAAVVSVILWLSGPSLPGINPNRSISTVQIPVANFDYPSISPDGYFLAFPGSDINGKWDIYIMDIKSGESRKLNVETPATRITGHINSLYFSPDGATISFGAMNPKTGIQGVYDISIFNGFIRTIADTGIVFCWSRTGNRIYYFRGIARAPSISGWREYWSISPYGNNTRLEFIDSLLGGADNSFAFSLSPDNKEAAFTRPFKGNFNEIMIRNLETGKETRLTYDRKSIDDIEWLNNGYIIFNSDRGGNPNIWAISSNGGKPKQITDETFNDFAMTMSTEKNRMIYMQQSGTGTLWKVNTDGSGNKQVFAGLNVWDASYSPDGEKLALIINNPLSTNNTFMLRNIKSGRQVVLVPDNAYKVWPLWSPSGKYISYLEFPQGPEVSTSRIKIIDIDKGGKPRDFGYGRTERWLNDSVLVIQRISGRGLIDFKHLGGRGKYVPSEIIDSRNFSSRLLNVRTGKERKFFPDSTRFAIPVLNGNKYIYEPAGNSPPYIVSKKELELNRNAKGKLLFDYKTLSKITGWSVFSNNWIYFRTKDNTIQKMDLKTLRVSKIIDLPGENFRICRWDNSDKYITYIQTQYKKNIVMIDSVFQK